MGEYCSSLSAFREGNFAISSTGEWIDTRILISLRLTTGKALLVDPKGLNGSGPREAEARCHTVKYLSTGRAFNGELVKACLSTEVLGPMPTPLRPPWMSSTYHGKQ